MQLPSQSRDIESMGFTQLLICHSLIDSMDVIRLGLSTEFKIMILQKSILLRLCICGTEIMQDFHNNMQCLSPLLMADVQRLIFLLNWNSKYSRISVCMGSVFTDPNQFQLEVATNLSGICFFKKFFVPKSRHLFLSAEVSKFQKSEDQFSAQRTYKA